MSDRKQIQPRSLLAHEISDELMARIQANAAAMVAEQGDEDDDGDDPGFELTWTPGLGAKESDQ